MIKVWKSQNFSVIQILREIKFGCSRSAKYAIFTYLEWLNFDFNEFLHFMKAKTDVFANLGALSFVNWVNFKLHKCKNSLKSKFRAKRCVKMADFAHLIPPKLISRKI